MVCFFIQPFLPQRRVVRSALNIRRLITSKSDLHTAAGCLYHTADSLLQTSYTPQIPVMNHNYKIDNTENLPHPDTEFG